MTVLRRIAIARIALAAMMFSTVSPAIAAALFGDRADILGRMLGVPVAEATGVSHVAAPSEDDGCPHEPEDVAAAQETPSTGGHPGEPGRHSEGGSGHAAHGTYCSFCLASSAVVVLPAAAWVDSSAPVAGVPVSGGHEREPASPRLSGHRSRGPPSLS